MRWHKGLSILITTTSCITTVQPSAVKPRVSIVGGGVGGLAIASRIAPFCDVHIYEKNDMIGGRCGSFSLEVEPFGKFRHERGPSLLLLKRAYEELFAECGTEKMQDYGLELSQCIPAYQAVFEDGDSIELGFPLSEKNSNDYEKSREKMDALEAEGAAKWDEYMKAMGAFLDCGLPNFIEERLDISSFPAFLREALRDGGKIWPLKPHSDVLESIFTSSKMRALASFQDLYVGLEPYRNENQLAGGVFRKTAPAVFGLLSALELHPDNDKAGVYAPIGGFAAVSQAMQNLAIQNGVQIHFSSTVTKITQEGIHLHDDTFLPSDATIINADLPYATQSLLSPSTEEIYDWDDSYDFSSGVIAFHWCFDKVLSALQTHNVFLISQPKRQRGSWDVLRDNAAFSTQSFNFYVHRPSKTDASAAPSGCDCVTVLVPCPTLNRMRDCAELSREEAMDLYKQQFGEAFIRNVKDAVLDRFSVLPGLERLREHIVHEIVDTPGTYADLYNVAAGVPFALSHGFSQLSITRPAPQSKQFSNVFFVGASTRPGNGVPLVLIGAKSIAQKVQSFLEKRNKEISSQS